MSEMPAMYGPLAARSFVDPLCFDPLAGSVVREPLAGRPGYWAGAPGAVYDPTGDRVLLCYRIRRPRGVEPDRGAEVRIIASRDGVSFDEDVFRLEKTTLQSPSIERCALVQLDTNRWVFFVSYVDPADNRWRIDRIEATDPSGFDPEAREPVLLPGELGVEGVKDPFLFRVGGLWHMIVSFATATTNADATQLHGTADAYNTGLIRSATGLAVSEDGRHWQWLGEVFGPRAGGWDRYCSRISTVWHDGGLWCAFYDGSASVQENYEEKLGFAYSFDLRTFHRVTLNGPLCTVPHASGSVRYVDVLDVPDRGRFVYYEVARPDGAHELRVVRAA